MTDQVKYTQKLKGAKVLVIGGSSGIGYSVAEALVEHECTVIVSSSNPARVEKTVQKLQQAYPSASSRITGHACNLADDSTLESNIVELFEKVGQLDHVIVTAGDALAALPLSELDLARVKKAGNVRYFAPLFIGKHAPKYLSAGPNSSIVLTTGSVSERPIPGWTMVASYATGLQGMTRGLALDLAPIRVNLVSPGPVDTELWATAGMSEEQKQGMFQGTKTLTGRVASPEQLAESFLYLLKDTNVTGTMISTSSGTLLCS